MGQVQVVTRRVAPEPHVAGGGKLGRARCGQVRRADDVGARRRPGHPAAVGEARPSDDRPVVLDQPAGRARQDQLHRGDRPGPDRDPHRRDAPAVAANGAGCDAEVPAIEHGRVDDPAGGLQGKHRGVRRDAGDRDPGPGGPAVMGCPQVGPEGPPVVRVGEAETADARGCLARAPGHRGGGCRRRGPRPSPIAGPRDRRARAARAGAGPQDPSRVGGDERHGRGLETQDGCREHGLDRGCRGRGRRGRDRRGRRRGHRGRRAGCPWPKRPARGVPAVPRQDERRDGDDHDRGCGQLRREASVARQARDGALGRRLPGRDRADPGHQVVRDRMRRGGAQRGSHLALERLVVLHGRDLPSSWASTAARRRRSA